MLVRVNISLKERKNKYSISQCRLFFKEKWSDLLEIDPSLDTLKIIFNRDKPEQFIIKKGTGSEIDDNNIIEKEIKLAKAKNKKNGVSYYITIPSAISSNFNFRESFNCFCEEDYEKKEVRLFLPYSYEEKKNVILVKVNKGGIGKTFLTAQIAHGLALFDKKVLIITSDSQNNILNYMYPGKKEISHGIISDVLRKEGIIINLRENLDFIPLESNKLTSAFIERFHSWLQNKKEEYDYILIDSVPTMKIDHEFLMAADKIIIPAFCDEATIEGILNLLEDIDIKKVIAIQINKFKRRVIEMKYKEYLENNLKDTDILFPEPILDSSFVESMLEKKKTVWEYKNKTANDIQDTLVKIIHKIIVEVEGEIESKIEEQ